MQEFNYLAKNKDGESQKGLVEAENDTTAAKLLVEKGLVPIEILPKKIEKFNLFSFINRVSIKDKAIFARQLATMINAGLPISQAISTFTEQTSNVKLKEVGTMARKDIEGGAQLSATLAKFPATFRQIDISLIEIGEASGSLDKSLLRLADQTEKIYKMNKKIKSAFTYPAFIVVVIIVVLCVMIIYVMPQMESLYKSFNADLPLITRFMIGISHFLTRFGIYFLALLVAFFSVLKSLASKPPGKNIWDSLKLKAPVFGGFFKKVYIARFARTLSGLVSSGVPVLDSLKIVSDAIGNEIFKEVILASAEDVKEGIFLSETLKKSDHIPTLVCQMINVGEKTGELDNMLDNLADFYEEEVDTIVKNFSTLLEPIIIVVMGLVVGTLLVAVMMPIYGLSKVLFK